MITSTVCYKLGYVMGQYRTIRGEPEISAKPATVNLNFFQYEKKIRDWFFPCKVIHVEVIERDEHDNKFYNEMRGLIKQFLSERNHSAFVEYCDGSCIEQNDQNRTK